MPVKSSDKVFALRLPITMHDFFKEQAEKNKRSINAEILIALEERQEKIKSSVDEQGQVI